MRTPHRIGINQRPMGEHQRRSKSYRARKALWAKMWPSLVGCGCAALGVLIGCTTPAYQFDRTALQLGLQGNVLEGKHFLHKVYRNHAFGSRVHIYLDGDGTPWLTRHLIANDPTPRDPLVLQWLVQDHAPSWYVGRPCYHGVQIGCDWTAWTDRRYSPEVVSSMAAVIEQIMQDYQKLVLIGYSGGGTLAMLLAEQLAATQAIITVAGNLDVAAWTDWHGYSPLSGSLNPAHRPPLPSAIIQHHWAGGRDRVVPAWIVAQGVRAQTTAQVYVMEDFDHHCCWQRHWPSILHNLEVALFPSH